MAAAWYKTGTVNITTGTQAVVGEGVNFISNIRVGDGFRGPDGEWYEVTNVASENAIAIFPSYAGPTVAGGTYLVAPLQGYVKESADRLRKIVDKYGDILEIIGDSNLIARVAMVDADATGNIPAEDLAVALGIPGLQPKETGKGLSQEDFTTLLKNSLEQLPGQVSALEAGKVDKVEGKGLSTNDFSDALQAKLASLESSHFKGEFPSLAALQAAIPTGTAGDYARLDAGVGSDVETALWDTTDNVWVKRASEGGPMTPAEIKEGYESNANTNAYTDSDKSKLAAIEAQATKNASDSALRDRSTHTGTQLAATISDLAAAVRAVLLGSGLATNVETPILVSDSALTAFGKLQGQLNLLGRIKAAAGENSDITKITGLTTPLSIAQGGNGGLVGLPTTDANANLNNGNYTTAGTWTGSVFSGTDGRNQGYLQHDNWSSTDYAVQYFASLDSTVARYKRFKTNGTWGAWTETSSSSSGGGLAVGTMFAWKFNRATIPGGSLPHDGQIVANGRTLYPDFWALIQPFCVSDATWLAAPYTSRGMFSSGDGSTSFRMPDDNGKHSDGNTIAAMFLRGDGKNSAGTPGLHQADQMQGFRFGVAAGGWTMSDNDGYGAASTTGSGVRGIYARQSGAIYVPITDGTNGTPRVGSETRSPSSTVIWCTTVAKTGVNAGTVDVTVLANQVTALQAKPDPIGVNQAWTDLTQSRAANTVYTNTTGRPIMVSVSMYASTTGYIGRATIGGVLMQGNWQAGSNVYTLIQFIVPAGATYSCTLSAGTPVIYNWLELR